MAQVATIPTADSATTGNAAGGAISTAFAIVSAISARLYSTATS